MLGRRGGQVLGLDEHVVADTTPNDETKATDVGILQLHGPKTQRSRTARFCFPGKALKQSVINMWGYSGHRTAVGGKVTMIVEKDRPGWSCCWALLGRRLSSPFRRSPDVLLIVRWIGSVQDLAAMFPSLFSERAAVCSVNAEIRLSKDAG